MWICSLSVSSGKTPKSGSPVEHMKSFTRNQHQDAIENSVSSPSDSELMLHHPATYCVVVLGVIYPSVVRQPRYQAPLAEPALPAGATEVRRSADIIFYDPLSSRASLESLRGNRTAVGEPSQTSARRTGKGRQEAINAVVADLARLAKNHYRSKSRKGNRKCLLINSGHETQRRHWLLRAPGHSAAVEESFWPPLNRWLRIAAETSRNGYVSQVPRRRLSAQSPRNTIPTSRAAAPKPPGLHSPVWILK